MISQQPVDWETATAPPRVTHILDSSSRGTSGLGVLTHPNQDGPGVRIIIAGASEGTNSEVGYKPDRFDRDSEHAVKYPVHWPKEHGPKLVRPRQAETFADTKRSRLLLEPPVTVARMTPCTLLWDFVAAAMNAG